MKLDQYQEGFIAGYEEGFKNCTADGKAAHLEIKRLRAALMEISAYTAEPKLYDHEEDMSDRLDSIYKVIEKALGNE